MGVFLSTFVNKIDKKGRVSTPSAFRAVLKQDSFPGFVAFRSLTHPCIEGFAMGHMQRFSDTVNSFQLFEEDQADLTASVFADSEALSFDQDGRVMLTPTMIQHAGLTDAVCFAGRGPTFQLWNPTAFKAYQEDARGRIKTKRPTLQGTASGIITPPKTGEAS